MNYKITFIVFFILFFSSFAQLTKLATKKRNVDVLKNENLKEDFSDNLSDHSKISAIRKKIENKVKRAQLKVNMSKTLSKEVKNYKQKILEMFLEELKESEIDMLESEKAFRKAIMMDFWNASSLKENSRKRLESLRIATLKEERSFQRIEKFSEDLKAFAEFSNDSSWVNEILKEISHAADILEDTISDSNLDKADGAQIEAVLHVREGGKKDLQNKLEKESKKNPSKDGSINNDDGYDESLDVLIDSRQNKYILSKQQNSMNPLVDHALVIELIYVLLASVFFGYFCHFINVPSLFGCIFTGLVLGPSGLNIVDEMVQVETIGEIGVFFIMFAAGLEFSFVRVRKVWKVALQCPVYVTLSMVVLGVFIGSFNSVPVGESSFISACLSFSSTPLITRFVGNTGEVHSTEYSTTLLGILITQDIQLSLLMALMPSLAIHKVKESFLETFLHFFMVFLKRIFSIGFVLFIMVAIAKSIFPYYTKFLNNQSRELQLLGTLAVMFLTQLFTTNLALSMELGCFIAGAVVSYTSHNSPNKLPKGLLNIENAVLAVHDFFSSLFFVSIGFHIFPTFVISEFSLLVSLTILVISGKFLLSLLILKLVMPVQAQKLKWIVSSGLAQISEFSFVLGSRARHLKIISREVFLLIISVTTLSLLFAPLLWNISLWRFNKYHF